MTRPEGTSVTILRGSVRRTDHEGVRSPRENLIDRPVRFRFGVKFQVEDRFGQVCDRDMGGNLSFLFRSNRKAVDKDERSIKIRTPFLDSFLRRIILCWVVISGDGPCARPPGPVVVAGSR